MSSQRLGLTGLIILCAFVAPGCGDGSPGGIVVSGRPVDRVIVTPALRTLLEGATAQLTVEVLDEDGGAISGASVSWDSSRPSVASVDREGLVTAESPGIAEISATARSGGSEAVGISIVTVEAEAPAFR